MRAYEFQFNAGMVDNPGNDHRHDQSAAKYNDSDGPKG
jgi:hypothetical protein